MYNGEEEYLHTASFPMTNDGRNAVSRSIELAQNRYKNKNIRNSNDDYRAPSSKLDPNRGSSRFSKGYDEELDKVADRINHSILLNSQSNCDDVLPGVKENHRAESESKDGEGSRDDSSAELPMTSKMNNRSKPNQRRNKQNSNMLI